MQDGEKEESSGEGAKRNNYLNRAIETLDDLVLDWFDQEMQKAQVSAPQLAAECSINYNTWHKNGVTPMLAAEINCISYVPWKGFQFEIDEYVKERQEELGIELEEVESE